MLLLVLVWLRWKTRKQLWHPRTMATAGAATACYQAPNVMEVSSLECGRVPWAPCGTGKALLLLCEDVAAAGLPLPWWELGTWETLGQRRGCGRKELWCPQATSRFPQLWAPKRCRSWVPTSPATWHCQPILPLLWQPWEGGFK